MTSEVEFELLVIGGGSGGLAAAKEAADLGAKVAVIDYVTPSPQGTKWGIGGTCLNVGCIPKKLMHQAAKLGQDVQDSVKYGWRMLEPEKIQNKWEILRTAVQGHIKSGNFSTKVEIREKGITYYNNFAYFKDAYTVEIDENGEKIHFKSKFFLIATGLRPSYPDVPGALEYGITSDDIFFKKDPPGKTLVVGAGLVGVESAGLLKGLGYDVTMLVRTVVLRLYDQEMAQILQASLVNMGINIKVSCHLKSIEKEENGLLKITWDDNLNMAEVTDTFDTVLLAIGRKCTTDLLKLQDIGIDITPEGKIIAKNERTNIPHIYAVGDVLDGKRELTPVAIQAGVLLARRLFGNSTIQMNYLGVPTTIFSAPLEYACVGFREEAAIETFGEEEIDVYHNYYQPTEFYIPEKTMEYCFLKVVAKKHEDQKIIGFHILAPNAGEIMQGFAVAMKCGITIPTLLDVVIGIHPTIAQEFVNLTITKRSGLTPRNNSCCS